MLPAVEGIKVAIMGCEDSLNQVIVARHPPGIKPSDTRYGPGIFLQWNKNEFTLQ
jgi:hypothetical protein